MSSSGATPSDTVEPLAPVTWLFGEPPIAVAPEELSSPHSTEVAQQHDPVQVRLCFGDDLDAVVDAAMRQP